MKVLSFRFDLIPLHCTLLIVIYQAKKNTLFDEFVRYLNGTYIFITQLDTSEVQIYIISITFTQKVQLLH